MFSAALFVLSLVSPVPPSAVVVVKAAPAACESFIKLNGVRVTVCGGEVQGRGVSW